MLVCLGFGLRIYHIDHFSFWIDEALTPIRANYTLLDILRNVVIIQDFSTDDTNPPLYFLFIHFLIPLFGETDFAYRFPSALFGTLSIPLMFVWGRSMGYSVLPQRAGLLGLVAAAMLAVSPLSVWYSQEARMYTLLVFWAIGLNYITWLAIQMAQSEQTEKGAAITRLFIIYLLVVKLAGATHITGLFLAAGHSLIWAWILWQHTTYGLRLIQFGIAGVIIALPLLPFVVPRLFTQAEAGFSVVSPWTIFFDLINGYSMGVTAPDIAWLRTGFWWLYLLFTGLGLISLWRNKRFLVFFFLLSALLMPAIVTTTITQITKPIYQGIRHIMLGHPAFLMLISLAVLDMPSLRIPSSPQSPNQSVIQSLRHSVTLLSALLLFSGFTLSLNALYTNPDVAKDDLRGMVARIEHRAGNSDVVIYNDVILMLVHDHYATRSDLLVTSLPVYPLPVIEETVPLLSELAQQHDRVWFIPSPPVDDRDKDRVVQNWLLDHTLMFEEHWHASKSTELKVEGYQTGAIVSENRQRAAVESITLTNVSLLGESDSQIWIETGWMGEQPPHNTEIIFRLNGSDDWEWVYDQQGFLFQSEIDQLQDRPPAWDPDQINLRQFGIDRPIGLSAGTYQLTVELQHVGQNLGRFDQIADLTLGKPEPLPDNRPLIDRSIRFENGLALERVELADEAVRPGHILPAHAIWTASPETNLEQLSFQMQVFDPDNRLVFERSGRQNDNWPAIPAGIPTRDHVEIIFPPDAQPGLYDVRWQVSDANGPLQGQTGWWPFGQTWNTLGSVEVTPWPYIKEAPLVDITHEAQFENIGMLKGSTIVQAETELEVENVWLVSNRPSGNFFSFVHVVDPSSGTIVAQRDWIPVDGQRPTQGWRPDEVIIDQHRLDLSQIPNGRYLITTGLYLPNTFERPLVTQEGNQLPDRQVVVGEIER